MTALVVVASLALLLVVAAGWFVKRKLATMGQHLPAAIEQWEKEIEKLEKPKG